MREPANQNLVRKILAVQVNLASLLSRVVTLVLFVFLVWLADTSLTEIGFGAWLQERWFLWAGVIALLVFGFSSFDSEEARSQRSFLDLSQKFDEASHGRFSDDKNMAGAVEYDGHLLGPYLVWVNKNGIRIDIKPPESVFFPWERIQSPTLVVAQDRGTGLRFETPTNRLGNTTPVVIPWNKAWGVPTEAS